MRFVQLKRNKICICFISFWGTRPICNCSLWGCRFCSSLHASFVYLSLWTFSYSSTCTKLLMKGSYSCISLWATEKVNNLIQDSFMIKEEFVFIFIFFLK